MKNLLYLFFLFMLSGCMNYPGMRSNPKELPSPLVYPLDSAAESGNQG